MSEIDRLREENRALWQVLEPIQHRPPRQLRGIASRMKNGQNWDVGELLIRACILFDTLQPMENWWLSWYEPLVGTFTMTWPWWITGERADGYLTICAAVRAKTEQDAKLIISDMVDADVEWRFCERKHRYWLPFNERFKREGWMEWPEGE